MKLKSCSCAAPLIGLLVICTVAKSNADMATEAKELMEKGIVAAKQQDYQLAIQYFQEVRPKASDEPILYFNLGLAEAKIPGRELRAICWLEAFLATNPTGSKPEAVNNLIKELEVKSAGHLSHLIQSLQEMAIRLPAKPAANMAYYYYSDNPVVEKIEFYGFWPLRQIGYHVPGFKMRHNDERYMGPLYNGL